MIIEDAIVIAGLTGMIGLGSYFVKWLTNNMTEAVKANTDAVRALTLIIEKCRYREQGEK